MAKKDYKQGYHDGVAACSNFLIDATDMPSVAEDMKQYILPNRNWRKRFWDKTGFKIKHRWTKPCGLIKEEQMSKMKQYIDLMTPMEAYQKGYDKGQEDVCTVSVSDIYEKGVQRGGQEVVEFMMGKKPVSHTYLDRHNREKYWFEFNVDSDEWQAQLKKWGIKDGN